MPTDEYSRSEYIRELLKNKKSTLAQGGSLVNPSISGLAALDTSFQGVQPQNLEKEQKANGFDSFMQNVLGFVDEMAAKFGSGFVNGWEGILDLGATGIGALGDATGWYDGKTFTDWAKQDIGNAAAEWSKTAWGLGSWYNRGKGLVQGNYDASEWGDILKTFGDFSKSAFFMKNDLYDMRSELTDKRYGANDEVLGEMNIGDFKAGEFLGGAAHSVGFMLPSIMTAGAGAAAGAGKVGQQAISLGTMGLGAAGKGSEEALNDGATSGQALGYGALSGTAEVASELVVGKALGLVGLGTGKIAGVVGKGSAKTTAKIGSKLFTKELVKTMFEEGMEEVSTAVLEPLFKSVYKGKDALEDYKSMDYWFGADGHFNESVLGQFTSGAFVGGLSGGIQQSAVYRKVGSDGYVALQNFQNLGEEDAKMAKLEVQKKTDGKAYTEATNARTEAMKDFIESVDKLMKNGTEAQKKAFAEFLTNKNTVAKWEKEDKNLESNISKFVDKFASHESTQIESFRNEMNRRFGTDFEYEIEKGEIKTDSEGRKLTARIEGNKIIINENVIKQKGGSKIAHEYMAHHLLKSLPSEIKSKLFRDVQNTEWYKNNKEEIDDLYGDQAKEVYNEEAFALYMEHVFKGDNVATQIENMRQVFGSKGLFSGLQRILRGAKKFKSPELIKQYAKTLDKVTKAMIKAKIYSREGLADFIKKVDELKQRVEQPAYSKAKGDELFTNIKTRYNKYLKNNPNFSGRVFVSGNYICLVNSSDSIPNVTKKFLVDDTFTLEERNYILDKFIEGEDYNDKEFIKSIRESIANIRKSKLGNQRDGVQRIEYRLQGRDVKTAKDVANGYEGVSNEVKYSKESSGVTGKYTVGDNKKPLEIVKIGKRYEVVFPSEGRTITEAKVGDDIIKFDDIKNVRAYLKDIKAKKVEYERKEKQPHLSKPQSIEVKNAPTEAEMRKADDTKRTKRAKIYNGASVFVNDGDKISEYKIKKTKDGVWSATIADESTAEIVEKEYKSFKALRAEIDSYTNVSNNRDDVILKTVQKNNTVSNKEAKNEQKKVNESKKTKENKPKEQKTKTENKGTKNTKIAENSQKRENKNTYKDYSTTKDIIDKSIDFIQNELGEGYIVSAPVNMSDFTNRTFTDINQVKESKAMANRLVNKLLETSVYENNKYVGSLEDMLEDKQIEQLKKAAQEIIESAPNSKARSRAARAFQIQLERAQVEAKEYKTGQSRTRVAVRLRDRIRKNINRFYQITDNDVIKNGLYLLYDPFEKLHGAQKGGFEAKGFKENLYKAIEWYNEQNIHEHYEGLTYSEEIRNALVDLYNSLGEGVQRANGTVYKTLTTESMQKTIDTIRLINDAIRQMIQEHTDTILPSSMQTIASVKRSNYGQSRNVLARFFRMYKRGFAPAYVVLEEMLGGNSEAVKILVYDMQNAVNQKTLYTGAYHDAINKELKRLGIKKTFDSKHLQFRGHDLTIDQAMGLYLSTKVQANFDAINTDGANFYDEKNGLVVELAKKGEAQALKTEIESALPKEYKDLADWLLDTINGSVKAEYIEWFENKYGKYHMRNEVGVIKDNSYWTLKRSYQKLSNITKAVSNPDAVFSHSIRRTSGGHNEVLITGALSTFDSYIEKLGKELYTKPVYEKALGVLNTKANGSSVMDIISKRVESKDIDYLKKTMENMLGVNQRQANMLDKMVSAFSVAKLSLNIGSMMKQFASIWTSNLPIRKSAKGLLAKMFGNSEIRKEYKTLVDEIGGLKYREAGKGVLRANADSVGKLTEKIAKVGMIGISKVDMFTISTGVYSLMVIGQDQFNAKIGTQANIDFVKEHWSEFELSQIGNTALSKNGISNSDNLTRYLFGFLQGANRAALGSQIHKIGLWRRNRNVNEQQLKTQLKEAKKVVGDTKSAYELDPDNADARKAYIEANAEVVDLENRLKDFNSYKIAGGRSIPRQMATGILAQGVFIALINALMKRIKGKKDWDELDVAEEGMALALSIGVDWVPMVNQIASIIQGYEVTVPAVDILNQFSDIFKDGKNGSWKSMIRKIALLVGDMTGIPFKTIYDYIYGTLKAFDPSIAYEMRSALYGSSVQSATTTMKTYADRGSLTKTASMVNLVLTKFKTGSTTSDINKEIATLYINGYHDVMPKSTITSYTNEDGDIIELTKEQQRIFNELYGKSTKDVSKLLQLTEYRSLTDEEKAKAIKKIYDMYYSVAKATAIGRNVEGKLANILALTHGNLDMAKYVIYLQKVAQINETKKKTRKEMVIKYVNRLKGFTKAEKALLMYLAGYSVSGNSEKALKSLLVSKGVSKNVVKELV